MVIKMSTVFFAIIAMLGMELFQMEIFIISILFLAILIAYRKKSMKISAEFIVLVACFTINYFVLSAKDTVSLSIFNLIRAFLGPIMGYIIGYFVVDKDRNRLETLIYVLGMSYFAHGVLNLFSTTTLSTSSRYVNNIWTGDPTTATLQTTYFIFAISIAVFWIFFKRKFYRLGGICILGAALWNAMQTASRTPLYLIALTLVGGYTMKQYHSKEKKEFFKNTFKLLFILLLSVIVLILLYHNNIFGIKETFESSFLGQRLSMIDREIGDTRLEIWIDSFQKLITHPMGYEDEEYAHNMWLDMGKETGILTFALLVVYTGMILYRLWKNVYKKKSEGNRRFLLVFFYAVACVDFMLEPILQGVPFVFISFCMINGGVASLGEESLDENSENDKRVLDPFELELRKYL